MSTLSEIAALIQEQYGIEPAGLDPDKPLSEYGLDSLTLVELMFSLEDHFHISFTESRTDIQTLTALAALVDELRAVAA